MAIVRGGQLDRVDDVAGSQISASAARCGRSRARRRPQSETPVGPQEAAAAARTSRRYAGVSDGLRRYASDPDVPRLRVRHDAAARVGAELLGRARRGDDRRDRGGARGPCAAARRARRCRPQPLRLHARRHRARAGRGAASPAVGSRGSGSTCAATRAPTLGSARPTSCRSCRSARTTCERARDLALALGERLGELGLPVFVYSPPERGPGVLPPGRHRGAAAPARRRRARAGLRPAAARSDGRRRDRRRAAAADRLQRQPARLARERRRRSPRSVRESGGGFPGVRALGLDLPRAGLVQVSMNVEDWEAAALPRDRRAHRARGAGAGGGGDRLGARGPRARWSRGDGGGRGTPDRGFRRDADPRAAALTELG